MSRQRQRRCTRQPATCCCRGACLLLPLTAALHCAIQSANPPHPALSPPTHRHPLPSSQVDYFTAFLKLRPYGTLNESHVRFLTPEHDVGINSGVYTFDIVKDGEPQKVQARYSFVYRLINGDWKITEHHSSAMPEPVVNPLDAVAAQFDRWNSALQTGDPEVVASLYADDGVLLPTVSNKVRTDHAGKVRNEQKERNAEQGAQPPAASSSSGGTNIACRPACSAATAAFTTLRLLLPDLCPLVLLPPPPALSQVDYFTNFLKLKPFGTINESHVRFLSAAHDLACNSGIYTFDIVKDGEPQKVGFWPAGCWEVGHMCACAAAKHAGCFARSQSVAVPTSGSPTLSAAHNKLTSIWCPPRSSPSPHHACRSRPATPLCTA